MSVIFQQLHHKTLVRARSANPFLALVVSAILTTSTVASASVQARPLHSKQVLGFAPSQPLSPEYARLFELGRGSNLSPVQISSVIKDFESRVARIYRQLSIDLAHVPSGAPITASNQAKVVAVSVIARDALNDLQKTVLIRSRVPATELHRFEIAQVSSPVAFRTYGNVGFSYFMAGLSRRVGVYVKPSNPVRRYAGGFSIQFPALCFSSMGQRREGSLPEEVRSLFDHPDFAKVTGNLFDTSITRFRETAFEDSRSYSFDGYENSCRYLGEVDPLTPDREILLYVGDVYKRQLPGNGVELAEAEIETTRIHEVMHYVARRKCDLPSASEGVMFSHRATEEAKAAIATLAALTISKPPARWGQALRETLITTALENYRLTFELVYKPLFLLAVQRDFERYRKAYLRGSLLTHEDFPEYMELRVTPVSADALAEGENLLGELMVDGTKRWVTVRITRQSFGSRHALMSRTTTAADVLRITRLGLEAIDNALQKQCGAGADLAHPKS